jgi:hypothetical protein
MGVAHQALETVTVNGTTGPDNLAIVGDAPAVRRSVNRHVWLSAFCFGRNGLHSGLRALLARHDVRQMVLRVVL